MTTGKAPPRHVICVLGNWTDFAPIKEALEAYSSGFTLDVDYSALSPNSRMMRSFQVNQDRLPSTMTPQDWEAVETHSAVAYVLSPAMPAENAETISGEALKVIAALFAAGATAIQSESAGLSHGKDRWIDLAAKFVAAEDKNDQFEMGATLYKSWVHRGIFETITISIILSGCIYSGIEILNFKRPQIRPKRR